MLRSGNCCSVYASDRAVKFRDTFRYPPYLPSGFLAVPLLVPVIVLLLLVSPAGALDWTTETVDSTGDTGYYSSLALDDAARPQISYMDFTSYHLKYAAKIDGAWIIETLDATHGTGEFCSLELDASGQPIISYFDVNWGNLSVATKTGNVWTRVTADSGGVGRYTSIALDDNGNPRIAYQDLFNMKLKYAERTGGLWTNETADSGNVGAYASLALDKEGNPGISYYDAAHGFLKYAAKSGGLWSNTTIDTTGNAGYFTSIAFDDTGNPCISYYDKLNKDLKYASKTEGVWRREVVDSGGDVGMYTSLSLDTSGNPHISYYDATNGHLKYAVKSGPAWTYETVDSGLNVGLYTSLVLDESGNPRISYRDGGNGDLKFAVGIPPLILNFTASSRTGTAPLNVEFSDTSTGGSPSCWNWSFGDGAWFNTSEAALRDPGHVYENPGSYSVTLIVQNLTISETLTKPGYITVVAPPETMVTTFSTTPTPPDTPTPIPPSPEPTPAVTPSPDPTSSVTPTPSPSSTPEPTSSLTPEPSSSLTPVITCSPVPSPAPDSISDNGYDPWPSVYQTAVHSDDAPRRYQTVNVSGESAVTRANITGEYTDGCMVTARKTALPIGGIPPEGRVFQYITITTSGCPFISIVQLGFEVPESFVKDSQAAVDDIRLCQLRNHTWICMPSTNLGSNNSCALYQGDGPEYTLNAITLPGKTGESIREESSAVIPATQEVLETESVNPVFQDSPVTMTATSLPIASLYGFSWMDLASGITMIAGVGIGAVLFRRWKIL